MEFFTWLLIPQIIVSNFVYNTGMTYQQYGVYLAICCGVAGFLYLVSLVFGGLGLYTMAKRAGLKHAWLGFLPFVNTYYAGKVAGEANFFGQRMKRAGLYAMLAEIAYVALSVFIMVIDVYLANPLYYKTVEINGYAQRQLSTELMPINLHWMVPAQYWSSAIAYLAELVMVVFFFVVYIALFRKYYSRGPILMALLCALLPCRGFVLFAVRKNAPFDYNAYMRRRVEAVMRQQQGQNGGGTPYSGGSQSADPSPFGEFGGSEGSDGSGGPGSGSGKDDDSPFSDF